jgi:hypothetical protein
MIPNVSLFTEADEKLCTRLFFWGFFFLPGLWLYNWLYFSANLTKLSYSFDTYLVLADKMGQYEHVRRTFRIKKYVSWSKFMTFFMLFALLGWFCVYQYLATTNNFWDNIFGAISILPGPIDNPYGVGS